MSTNRCSPIWVHPQKDPRLHFGKSFALRCNEFYFTYITSDKLLQTENVYLREWYCNLEYVQHE